MFVFFHGIIFNIYIMLPFAPQEVSCRMPESCSTCFWNDGKDPISPSQRGQVSNVSAIPVKWQFEALFG